MNTEKAPYKFAELDPEINELLLKHYYAGTKDTYVHVGDTGYLYPKASKDILPKFFTMDLRPDDIFVATFPRSGTTWVQELVWMVGNDLDFEKSAATPSHEKYLFLEYTSLFNAEMINELTKTFSGDEQKMKLLNELTESAIEKLATLPSPRFVKTHLPFSLLPPTMINTVKTVYVARNPKDVMVSFYHFLKYMGIYDGDFKTFWKLFIKGAVMNGPYFEHIKEAWQKRNNPNLLFLFYEELSKDLPTAISKVINFFGKKFTEDQIKKLCDHLSIENFRKMNFKDVDIIAELGLTRPDEQPFIRKGKVGGWRDYLDEEMLRQTDEWIADNLKDTDLRFPE